MAEVLIGKVADFRDPDRWLVTIDGRDIGIVRREGSFYAYENRCPHMGGPVCQGIVFPRIEAVLGDDRAVIEDRFSNEMHLICPWHGWEFRLDDGVCSTDSHFRLTKYEVVERNGEVYLQA